MKNTILKKSYKCAGFLLVCICLVGCAALVAGAASLSEMYENGVVSDAGIPLGDVRDGIISDVSEDNGNPLWDSTGNGMSGAGRAGSPDDRFGTESSTGSGDGMYAEDPLLPGESGNAGGMNGTGGANDTNGTDGMPSAERATDNTDDGTGSKVAGVIIAVVVVIVVVVIIYMLIPKKRS